MLGVNLKFIVDFTLFTPNLENVTDEEGTRTVKEGVGQVDKLVQHAMCDVFANVLNSKFDTMNCELSMIEYLDPEDVDIDIDVVEV